MLIRHVTDEFQEKMDSGAVRVSDISSKQYGFMVDCDVDGSKLKLMFNAPELSNPDFDFDGAFLSNLAVRRCVKSYGQAYHVVADAEFKRADGETVVICTSHS